VKFKGAISGKEKFAENDLKVIEATEALICG
jgi:hypothetical protein